MLGFPACHPAFDALNVGVKIVGVVALQLLHNLWLERVARFLQQDFHDFRVEVFLQLRLGIIACLESIV